MKALVLDAGNSSSYHAMRSLARRGDEVHLVDSHFCHWRFSKFCARAIEEPAPAAGEDEQQATVEFLLSLLQQERYGLLLSCGDALTEAIYGNFDAFSALVDCAAPGPRVADVVLSKPRATEFARQLGVPVPATFELGEFGGNPFDLPTLPYPVVVKGQRGSGSSNVRFADGPEGLAKGFQEVRDLESDLAGGPAIQEYVGGPGYLVHLLFWQGEPYAAVCHRKDREYPVGGGVTAAATTVHEPDLLASALKIAQALEWHGLVKMDFLHDPVSGEFKFVEIDPRVSASVDIARAAGVDQVAMLADLVEGRAVKPDLTFRAGVRYRWLFPRDLLAGIANPGAYLRLLPDILSPRVSFDLGPSDWWPFFYQVGRFVQERKYLDSAIREEGRAARAIRAVYEARLAATRERALNGSV
jgi:predicted ATP-grasp superfamily ATP-dependent carboligase